MRHKFKHKRKFLFIVPIFILFALTALVMYLWNGILPDVIGIKSITYWQAMGILVLSKILFGGFHGFGKHKHSIRKQRLINNVRNMSPEEREKFKEEWKHRFKNKNWCKKD